MIPTLKVLNVRKLHEIDRPIALALCYGASVHNSGLLERIDEEGCGAVFAAACEPFWK